MAIGESGIDRSPCVPLDFSPSGPARACALVSAVAIATLLSACGSDSTRPPTRPLTRRRWRPAMPPTTRPRRHGTRPAIAAPAPADRPNGGDGRRVTTTSPRSRPTTRSSTTTSKIECIGETFVTAIGEDQLTSVGVAPGDIDRRRPARRPRPVDRPGDPPRRHRGAGGVRRPRDGVLASATATAEQTECATAIITNELAAEQLLVQVSGLEPSAEAPRRPRSPQRLLGG